MKTSKTQHGPFWRPLLHRELKNCLPAAVFLTVIVVWLSFTYFSAEWPMDHYLVSRLQAASGDLSMLERQAESAENPVNYLSDTGNMDYYGDASLSGTNIYSIGEKDMYGMLFSKAVADRQIMLGLAFMAGILLMVFLQFREQKSGRTGEFLAVLPYRKRTFLFAKTGAGILSYTLPLLLYLAVLALIYRENIGWIREKNLQCANYGKLLEAESFAHIAGVLFFFWAGLTAFYLGAVLLQYLLKSSWLAGLCTAAIPFAPSFVIICVNNLMIRYAGRTLDSYQRLLQGTLLPGAFFGREDIQISVGIGYPYVMYETEDYGLRLAIWLMLSVLFLGITAYFTVYKDSSASTASGGSVSGNRVFIFLLRGIFALCMGLAVSRIGYTYRLDFMILLVFMSAVALSAYFISGRVLELPGRLAGRKKSK